VVVSLTKIREDEDPKGCLFGGPLQLLVIAAVLVVALRRREPSDA
jgi:hypothetical protein